eukprot:CAMPEP_0115120874 /NCGR_PEP_ID=MMETSP0227-20121206/45935_1 /TAXON_ID=89957 /ORGANISM="Polarella glacialis, Strain CCMP 1383" /LENGTH=637 /DNA_ID=CAMNT_0002522595 /DNA_START=92 /DNA_END=2005 /DNA_ORIENTATION=-
MALEHTPKWFLDDLKKQPKSQTSTVTELKVFAGDETMSVPVVHSTTVLEMKHFLASKLGRDPASMSIVMKKGCSWRIQADCEEIARKVVVKGIKSFKREKMQWPKPIAIIGTGHAGLRQAMWFLKCKEYNFVVYDRKGQVGGTSWIDQANETSKLQTEMGTYLYDEDNPVPKNMSTWPSTAELLRHFQDVAEEYGILPYTKMCTNIKELVILSGTKQEQQAEMAAKQQGWATQTYKLTLEPTDGNGDGRGDNIGATGDPLYEVEHSAVIMYPGNLTIPKKVTLKGEETFGGPLSYAIMNDFNYKEATGKQIAILGHGAFAVENLRSCLEHSCAKAYMICRRKNISCPRVVSWFINQSMGPISGPLYMKSNLPAYDLIGFDPWAYYAVHTNEKRSTVTLNQKSRFGIGDVYFLAIAMGMCEVVEGDIKRLSERAVHMVSGQKIEADVYYGFNGNFDVDRLMNIKSMFGWWPDEDFRRFVIAEPIGVNATQFGGTSFSPGIRAWVEQSAHFLWYPSDWQIIINCGLMPKHPADPENDRPAYVVDARHGTSCTIAVSTVIQALATSVPGDLKRRKQLECHPMQRFLDECRGEWEDYGRKWKALGAPRDCPPYPYTYANVQVLLDENDREAQEQFQRQQNR